jgi:hypothetical protein
MTHLDRLDSQSSPAESSPISSPAAAICARIAIAMLIVIALANIAVRVYGCFIPLWFDEVFSLDQTRVIQYPVDILLKLHTDNNHYLTALWLWMIGPNAPFFVYRIPSLIAGLALPIFLYLAVYPRHGRRTALIAAFLALVSRHDTALACEARGYSMALALAALAWLILDRFIQRRSFALGFAFAVCCIAGFLAHLTFFYAYCGFGFWSLAALGDRDIRKTVRSLLLLHAPVIAFLAVLYRVDLQYLQFWGGGHITLSVLAKEFIFLTFNAPHGTTVIVGITALALVVTGWISVYRSGGGEWLLFAGVFAAAIAGLCDRFQVHTAPRYFLLTGPFLLVLVAVALDRLLDRGGLRIILFVLLIAMGAYGVTADAIKFWPGRAEYPEAVGYMAVNSEYADKTVSCGIDYRPDFFLLQFYCRRIDRTFVAANKDPGGTIPQWWVIPKSPDHVRDITRKDRQYFLNQIYPAQGQGWSWDVYRISPANSGT